MLWIFTGFHRFYWFCIVCPRFLRIGMGLSVAFYWYPIATSMILNAFHWMCHDCQWCLLLFIASPLGFAVIFIDFALHLHWFFMHGKAVLGACIGFYCSSLVLRWFLLVLHWFAIGFYCCPLDFLWLLLILHCFFVDSSCIALKCQRIALIFMLSIDSVLIVIGFHWLPLICIACHWIFCDFYGIAMGSSLDLNAPHWIAIVHWFLLLAIDFSLLLFDFCHDFHQFLWLGIGLVVFFVIDFAWLLHWVLMHFVAFLWVFIELCCF